PAPPAAHSRGTAGRSERVARGLQGLVGGELSAARRAARGAAGDAAESRRDRGTQQTPRRTDSESKHQPKETTMTTMPKAEVTLPSDSQVKVVRSFKAPRELVYKAYTTPALLK